MMESLKLQVGSLFGKGREEAASCFKDGGSLACCILCFHGHDHLPEAGSPCKEWHTSQY